MQRVLIFRSFVIHYWYALLKCALISQKLFPYAVQLQHNLHKNVKKSPILQYLCPVMFGFKCCWCLKATFELKGELHRFHTSKSEGRRRIKKLEDAFNKKMIYLALLQWFWSLISIFGADGGELHKISGVHFLYLQLLTKPPSYNCSPPISNKILQDNIQYTITGKLWFKL